MDDDQAYHEARRTVRSIRGFYVHFFIFLLVMTLLLAVNIVTGGAWWVQWPLLGWGIGIVAHAAAVFGLAGWPGSDWEERKIKELMARKLGR